MKNANYSTYDPFPCKEKNSTCVHKVGACVCVKMCILKDLQGNTAMILRD